MLASSPQCTSIKYIDCRNWFQFTQELLTLLLTLLIILHVTKHYRNLKNQKQENCVTEYQKSIRRKIRTNLVSLVYLGFLFFNTVFDLILFSWYTKQQGRDTIREFKLDGWYKVTEVTYVNLLNCLNLTVGFLYWKATRAYYVLSEINVPFLYRRWAKVAFFVVFFFIFAAVGIAVILQIIGLASQYIIAISISTLISTIFSILFCITCRILYRKYILTQVQLSPKAIKKQKIISVLLLLSSTLRITLYIIDTAIINWTQNLRNQQFSDNQECLDIKFYYSLVLLAINLFINLLPAAIYAHLFVSEVNLKKEGEDARARLKSDDSLYS